MRLIMTLAVATWAVQPLAAQQPTGHAPSAEAHAAVSADEAAVRAVLSQYKSAIEKLDATGTEQLFTEYSTIFETGGVEGTYASYLAHHLGPELHEFKTLAFSDYNVDVRFEGPVALANETYKYRIETKSGEIVERLGVATSVLKKINGQWKIISMHNSGRRPKPAS